MIFKINYKKNAYGVLEYASLIVIVVTSLWGISTFLERHIKGYIKAATDKELKKPVPLLWQLAVTRSNAETVVERGETFDGEISHNMDADTSFTTVRFPTPSDVIQSILHVLDKAKSEKKRTNLRNPINPKRLYRTDAYH
ncbi:MAG: hypothetical protein NC918_06050 [Candidatus Omnitrophica bacterium]|nr:hypothetical protein [Candidatus Omnitrophota bacterium]